VPIFISAESELSSKIARTKYILAFLALLTIMINIIFWNLNCKPLQDLLAALVKSYAVDVLILAENKIPTSRVLRALNAASPGYKTRPWSVCSRISIFTKFPAKFLQPLEESDRFLICRLTLPPRMEILLAMAHLSSKIYSDATDQLAECQLLSETVRRAEMKAKHTRTILVGDFNVNPFEAAVVGALGLHAVMAKQVAMRNSRTVQNKEYQFFYNPMWRYFGERLDGPPGTYYYGVGGQVTYFWNIFDQVLVRPALIPYFPDHELRILTAIGDMNLLSANGQPNRDVASDHLPMLFKLDI
jgi:hypothetical protein